MFVDAGPIVALLVGFGFGGAWPGWFRLAKEVAVDTDGSSARREPAIDFLSAHAAKLHGVSDRDVLEIAAAQGRILVTHDFRTVPKHFAEFLSVGGSSPGVIPREAAHAARVDHRGARARLDGIKAGGLDESDCANPASLNGPTVDA